MHGQQNIKTFLSPFTFKFCLTTSSHFSFAGVFSILWWWEGVRVWGRWGGCETNIGCLIQTPTKMSYLKSSQKNKKNKRKANKDVKETWIREGGNLLKEIDDYVTLRGINTTVVSFGRKHCIDQVTCIKLYIRWETFVRLCNRTFCFSFLSLFILQERSEGKQMSACYFFQRLVP